MMCGKDRAIGMVESVGVIFIGAVFLYGFGLEPNAGLFFGPLLIAAIRYWNYRRQTIVLVKDTSEVVLSMGRGPSDDMVNTFVEMGYRRKS